MCVRGRVFVSVCVHPYIHLGVSEIEREKEREEIGSY